jgi:homocysteine S-methyltransferase
MLTDSGLETWLIYHRGVELPLFASFPLLEDADGREHLAEYFRSHLEIAARTGTGIVLETPTWRASAKWGAALGYDAAALDLVNKASVAFLRDLGREFPDVDLIVSGNIGPQGDGYDPDELLTPDDAAAYHRPQIESFAAAGADRVTLLTGTHTGEPIGIAQAAVDVGIPVVIAFTVETDGRLPSGQPLHEAVAEVEAATEGAVLHYGINCAHPDHFADALTADPAIMERITLLRANASRMSHAELDEAEELDAGDPVELGELYAQILASHPELQVLGGCCGTDARHIDAIASACVVA